MKSKKKMKKKRLVMLWFGVRKGKNKTYAVTGPPLNSTATAEPSLGGSGLRVKVVTWRSPLAPGHALKSWAAVARAAVASKIDFILDEC